MRVVNSLLLLVAITLAGDFISYNNHRSIQANGAPAKKRLEVFDFLRRMKERQNRARDRRKYKTQSLLPEINVKPSDKANDHVEEHWTDRVHSKAMKIKPGNTHQRVGGPDQLYEEIIPRFLAKTELPRTIRAEDAVLLITTFLKQFGYLDLSEAQREKILSSPRNDGTIRPMDDYDREVLELDNDISRKISQLQNKLGLRETGTVDSETLETMTMPRCAMEDVAETMEGGDTIGAGNFVLKGAWTKFDLTYCILNYTDRLSPQEVDWSIAKALQLWEDASGLTFTRIPVGSGLCDLEIFFAEFKHGDKYVFDGLGGVLAHAFYPPYEWENPDEKSINGDLHFDLSEKFSVMGSYGIDLVQTAAHEFGHALGLMHSRNRRAVMAPVYRRYDPNFKLDVDDIEGIQLLYGEPSIIEEESNEKDYASTTETPIEESEKTTTEVDRQQTYLPTEGESPSLNDNTLANSKETDGNHGTPTYTTLMKTKESPKHRSKEGDGQYDCSTENIDAIIQTHSGKTYAVEGENLYSLDLNGTKKKFQLNSNPLWIDPPTNINAAFTKMSNGMEIHYVISDDLIWLYKDGIAMEGSPFGIDMFPDLVGTVDAAYWEPSYTKAFPETISIITGCFVYRYVLNNGASLLNKINFCMQLPEIRSPVTAAMVYNHRIYWFTDNQYYRIKEIDGIFSVYHSNPSYPKSINEYWFGCEHKEIKE